MRRNVVPEPVDATFGAISIQSGSRPTDPTRLCLDLAENEVAGRWDVTLTSKGRVPMRIIGAEASVRALAGRNKNAAVKLNGAAFTAAASCGEK